MDWGALEKWLSELYSPASTNFVPFYGGPLYHPNTAVLCSEPHRNFFSDTLAHARRSGRRMLCAKAAIILTIDHLVQLAKIACHILDR